MSNKRTSKLLYFCDGKACAEGDKIICFTQQGECCRTSDIRHAISKNDSDFPPVTFKHFFDTTYESFSRDSLADILKTKYATYAVLDKEFASTSSH